MPQLVQGLAVAIGVALAGCNLIVPGPTTPTVALGPPHFVDETEAQQFIVEGSATFDQDPFHTQVTQGGHCFHQINAHFTYVHYFDLFKIVNLD